MRGHRLRGTELVGMAGGALLVAGVFLPWYGTDASNSHSQVDGRPGDIAISLELGFAAALVATVLMIAAAAKRSSESERPRKPPGTI